MRILFSYELLLKNISINFFLSGVSGLLDFEYSMHPFQNLIIKWVYLCKLKKKNKNTEFAVRIHKSRGINSKISSLKLTRFCRPRKIQFRKMYSENFFMQCLHVHKYCSLHGWIMSIYDYHRKSKVFSCVSLTRSVLYLPSSVYSESLHENIG